VLAGGSDAGGRGDTRLAKRGNGMFISVYSGSPSSSLASVSEPRSRMGLRIGALDSWVGVVDGVDSGDIAGGHSIWSWSWGRSDNILVVVGGSKDIAIQVFKF
jgi:hypothetical protein